MILLQDGNLPLAAVCEGGDHTETAQLLIDGVEDVNKHNTVRY